MSIGFALSPTWLRGDTWRASDSRVEELFSLSAYADLARAAEAAHLDFLFNPDAVFLDPGVLETAPGFSTLDSHTLVSALVALTTRIGLVPTVQTAFAHPYTAARRLQSLQRLSAGRAGWNAVTALGGAENFGVAGPGEAPAADKYAKAAEFVALVHALWDSYPADALVHDRGSGLFADRDRVRPVSWAGESFRVRGPLSVAAHPAGPPPLFQAGGSPAGIAFAGASADAVFGCAPDLGSGRAQRTALRDAAVRSGRSPDAVRFLPGLSFVLAGSRSAARELVADASAGGPPHWTVVGTPADAAAVIEQWLDAGAIDGFIALAGGSWPSIALFFEEVVPLLVERGLFRKDYSRTTLRGHLGMPEG